MLLDNISIVDGTVFQYQKEINFMLYILFSTILYFFFFFMISNLTYSQKSPLFIIHSILYR